MEESAANSNAFTVYDEFSNINPITTEENKSESLKLDFAQTFLFTGFNPKLAAQFSKGNCKSCCSKGYYTIDFPSDLTMGEFVSYCACVVKNVKRLIDYARAAYPDGIAANFEKNVDLPPNLRSTEPTPELAPEGAPNV